MSDILICVHMDAKAQEQANKNHISMEDRIAKSNFVPEIGAKFRLANDNGDQVFFIVSDRYFETIEKEQLKVTLELSPEKSAQLTRYVDSLR